MKKRISLICLLAAVLAAVVFCALWQSAAQDRSALRALAQSGVAEAYALFFGLSGKGVRQRLLGWRGRIPRLSAGVHEPDGRNRQGREPPALERAREHLPEILDAIRLLAADVTDENAFVHLSELSSALEE